MNNTLRIALVAGSVATLSACNVIQPEAFDAKGIDVTAARNVPDQGNNFQRALHQSYADFAQWEYDQADFRDAKYYNDKGRMAATGQNVQPVVLSDRHLMSPHSGELTSGRTRLMQVVGNQETITRIPGPAAKAQVYFDCWAEQAEEGHQPEHIAFCKDGF